VPDASDEARANAIEIAVFQLSFTYESFQNAMPIAGATVAIDHPTKGRIELITNDQGRVVVPELADTKGFLPVAAHKPGFSIVTDEVPLEAAVDPRVSAIMLTPLAGPDLITVSGSAANMVSPANALLVFSGSTRDYFAASGANYQLRVARDRPFSLFGVEMGATPCMQAKLSCYDFTGWTRVDHGASAVDVTADLDLSKSLSVVNTNGTMTLPLGIMAGIVRVGMNVASYQTNLIHGFASRVDYGATSDTLSYHGEHVVWDGAPDVQTLYGAWTDEVVSSVRRASYPQDGAVIGGFFDAPVLVSPSDTSVPLSLIDAVEWVPQDGVQSSQVSLMRNDKEVWRVTTRHGSKITFRKPPSSASLVEILGNAEIDASLFLFGAIDPVLGYPSRYLYRLGLKLQP
jgi:hypothetical protein